MHCANQEWHFIYEYGIYKAHSMSVFMCVHFCPGHIYGLILKSRVPTDSPQPRDDQKNIKLLNFNSGAVGKGTDTMDSGLKCLDPM